MSDTFQFSQGTDGTTRYARLCIPGTGRKEKDAAPILLIKIESGQLVLEVYADILSSEPTHNIPLNGALLSKKAAPVTEARDASSNSA